MKSFVTYPLNFEKISFPEITQAQHGNVFSEYNLFKKVAHLEGAIVKCGIEAEEFTDFALFQNLVNSLTTQKVIAFEKCTKSLYVQRETSSLASLQFKTKKPVGGVDKLQGKLLKNGLSEINFISGNVDDTIADFLIENPEFKISYLSVNLDHYNATMHVLEFFYPRLVVGGILVLDNYSKKEEDYKAINDYFQYSPAGINNSFVNNGVHFIIRN